MEAVFLVGGLWWIDVLLGGEAFIKIKKLPIILFIGIYLKTPSFIAVEIERFESLFPKPLMVCNNN